VDTDARPGPIPRRSATPGRKPSSTTSARLDSAGPSSGSCSRSHTTDSLPALSAASHPGAADRSGSPSGASTRTTRAPSRNSSRPANGPGRLRVKSMTSRPCSTTTGDANTMLIPLRDRSTAQEDKRRLILDAAVRVFARKGYHTCRVGDIAEEAGVAHGLLYHYFTSKEEVLETIFRDTWTEVLDAFTAVEASDEPPREQLRHVAAILLRAWRRDPDLVRVLVREVARSPQVQSKVDELGQAFKAIERIVAHGQKEGAFRSDFDPQLLSWIFYGAIEEILTGWVLGQLPDGDEEVARAERTVAVLIGGALAASSEVGAAV